HDRRTRLRGHPEGRIPRHAQEALEGSSSTPEAPDDARTTSQEEIDVEEVRTSLVRSRSFYVFGSLALFLRRFAGASCMPTRKMTASAGSTAERASQVYVRYARSSSIS